MTSRSRSGFDTCRSVEDGDDGPSHLRQVLNRGSGPVEGRLRVDHQDHDAGIARPVPADANMARSSRRLGWKMLVSTRIPAMSDQGNAAHRPARGLGLWVTIDTLAPPSALVGSTCRYSARR